MNGLQILFIFLGLIVMLSSLWLQRMNSKAASWPSANGTIITSIPYANPKNTDSDIFIKYRYTINALTFESKVISFATRSDTRSDRERLVAKYPVGSIVPIYYDPNNPKTSVLERNPSRGWMGAFAIGTILIVIGFLLP